MNTNCSLICFRWIENVIEDNDDSYTRPALAITLHPHGHINALVLNQITKLKQRIDEFYSRYSKLTVQERESDDVLDHVLDSLLHIENLESSEYSTLGKVLLAS